MSNLKALVSHEPIKVEKQKDIDFVLGRTVRKTKWMSFSVFSLFLFFNLRKYHFHNVT